jgi:Transposase, Mutator family
MIETLNDVTKKKLAEVSAEEQAARELVRMAREQGLSLTGPDGLLKQLTKTVLETAVNEGMTEHLGHSKHAQPSGETGNIRNGTRSKTALTENTGHVEIDVPRDRAGTRNRSRAVATSGRGLEGTWRRDPSSRLQYWPAHRQTPLHGDWHREVLPSRQGLGVRSPPMSCRPTEMLGSERPSPSRIGPCVDRHRASAARTVPRGGPGLDGAGNRRQLSPRRDRAEIQRWRVAPASPTTRVEPNVRERPASRAVCALPFRVLSEFQACRGHPYQRDDRAGDGDAENSSGTRAQYQRHAGRNKLHGCHDSDA